MTSTTPSLQTRFAAAGAASAPSLAEQRVSSIRQYYTQVDSCDFAGVLSRFAPDATYEREGWEPLKGLEAIRDFFMNRRKLRGTHMVHPVDIQADAAPAEKLKDTPAGPHVYVTGSFTGHNEGTPVSLNFQDLWVFKPDTAQVAYRKSWIQMTPDKLAPVPGTTTVPPLARV